MISRIGKYTVDAELGRGGFGRVYRGYDPDVQRPVAIKVLTAESDPDLLKRFQVEIGTTGNLRHKNIVTLHECGEQSGVPYLVMELLEGQTLEHVIKGNAPLPLLDKVNIMTQIAEGLSYAHSKGVIHRDVKPGNIMLLPDGTVKIMDFGIARVSNRNTMVTREGFIIGTIPYMAPELFDAGGKADEQTDIFAYGDVYYELLTGSHPFSVEGEIYSTVGRIKNFEPEAVGQLVPNCPESLELLVHRAIAKDREVRYQSFAELLLDSEAILIDLQHERASSIMAEVGPLMDAGDLEAAELKLQQVVELEPGNREARRMRAGIKDQLRQLEIGKRVSALLAESEAQIRDRKFTDAVQTLENAQRLNKNDAGIQARLAEANARLNGHLQANKLVAEARRDQQKGQIEGALERLKKALELDPQHTDARSIFTRVEAELNRRSKENALQDAMRRASEHLAQKRYDDALAALQGLETDRTAAALRARIEREKEDAERRRRADQFNVAVAHLREALQTRELTKANHLLKYISAQFAGEPGTTQLVSDLRAQLDALVRAEAISRYTQQASELVRQKSLREALDVLDQALRQFPEDTALIHLRRSTEEAYAAQRRAEAIAAVLKQANALRELGNLAEALDVIARGRKALGEDAAVSELARRLEVELEQQRYAAGLQELLTRVQKLAEAGAHDEAIRAIDGAPEYSHESEVKALLSLARAAVAKREEQRQINAALDDARFLEQTESPERALTALEDALRGHPHNAALSQAANVLRDRIAEERRRVQIANHRGLIEKAMGEQDWKQAEVFLERARREWPGETLFDQLAEQVKRGIFEWGWNDVAAKVREKLAANAVSEAAEQLHQARMIYSGDPRWKSLEQEVAKRKAYESALGQAEQYRNRGELDKAEERLISLIRDGDPDDRATRMLEEIHDQRFSAQMTEADRAIGRGDFERGFALLETIRAGAPASWTAKIDAAYQEAKDKRQEALAGERRQREKDITVIAASVRRHLQLDEIPRAVAECAKGRSDFPDESIWASIEAEIDERKALLDVLQRAEQERKRGNYGAADHLLASLKAAGAGNERVRAARDAIASERGKKERAGALANARRELERLQREGNAESTAAFLVDLRRQFPKEADFATELALANAKRELESLKREGNAESTIAFLGDLTRQFPKETDFAAELALANAKRELERRKREGNAESTVAFLADLTRQFPKESDFAAELTRVKERAEALANARREMERVKRAGNAESTAAFLTDLTRRFPEETDFATELALADAKRELERRKREGNAASIIATLEDLRRRFPEEPDFATELTRVKERSEALANARRELERRKREGNAASIIATLEDLRRRFPEESDFASELTRIKERSEALANARRELERMKRAGNAESTAAFLVDLSRRFPEESDFATELALANAKRELERRKQEGNAASIIATLEDLRRRFPEETDFATELTRIKARAEAVANARRELERLKREGNAESTIAFLADLRRRFPEESEFAKEHDRAVAELARVKERTLQREDEKEFAKTHDGTVAIAARPEEKKPLPWKLIGGGIVAAAAIAAALIYIPPLFRPAPSLLSPVEIRTDPPGASVRVGNRSCVTPNCRVELAPGRYSVEARLNGYEPAQLVLMIDPHKSTGPVNLILQPLPAPPPPTEAGHPALAMGTLVVDAGTPNALVFVDNLPRGRTDATGRFSVRLEAKPHDVRVQKPGYEQTRDQRVKIADGASQAVAFSLVVQKATLELRGAPAGVEVRLGGTVLGKTNGSVFSAVVPPGDGMLQVTQGAAKREVAEKFEPGQTLALDWPSVAPPALPKPPPPPNPEAIEAQDWERVRNTSDPAELQSFLKKYPNGPHAPQAQSKLEDVVWSQTNANDPQALRAYMIRFPRSPHSQDASQRVAEVAWNGTDKKDAQALRAFMEQYPNSPHKSEAQTTLDQLEKQRLDAEQRLRQERTAQEQTQQAQQQSSVQGQAIRTALDQFNAAFESKRTRDVRDIWPSVPGRYLQAMGVPGSSFIMTLRPAGDARVSGDTASIPCELTTQTTVQGGQPSQAKKAVIVALRKNGERWIIVNPLGAP